MNAVGLQVPLLLVMALYGATTGGRFAFGQRLIAVPLLLLTNAIAQVFVAEAARLVRDDPAALAPVRPDAAPADDDRSAAVIAIAIGPLLVGPVFGSRWERAGLSGGVR